VQLDGSSALPINGLAFDPKLKSFHGLPAAAKRHLINI